jgi:hypothetical protein
MPQRLLGARKTTSSVCLVNQPKREYRHGILGAHTVHMKLRVQNNCEPEEPVGFERYLSRERVTARSGPQIHIDADEIAAIGDFSEINNGSIGGRENPPDFGNR